MIRTFRRIEISNTVPDENGIDAPARVSFGWPFGLMIPETNLSNRQKRARLRLMNVRPSYEMSVEEFLAKKAKNNGV